MAAPTASSDTLITPPSPVHISQSTPKPTTTAMDMDILSPAESPPPVVPKLIREASDITWQESLESRKGQVVLVRRRGRFRLLHQQQFKNSLLAGVGYLELANAGDFAANVWNQIPVPRFAAVLMGIGGVLALGDDPAWVGVREIGTEVIDRMVMDALMGFGSLLVGVGTLMAIGGANPRVFKASNLLSGYIGNGLAAVFGLVNAIWCGSLLRRFHVQDAAAFAQEPSDDIRRRLHTRFRRFQWHAGINGLTGIVAGAASMVTAERWWGYVVLIPCIISFILCNYFWRKKLGYDRPVFAHTSATEIQVTSLIEDLQYVIVMQRDLADPEHSLPQAIVRPDSLESILRFIIRENMLETYCESLARDTTTRHILAAFPSLNASPGQITISLDTLFRLPPSHLKLILEHAKQFLQTTGVCIFTYRERHLLELLGYAICQDHQKATSTTQDDMIEHT
ncbi:hypothetical protein N7519_002910 [Penicillium mononematosum]|uniref:uncharacterized protein n=1 Tax=Penicillium mononematosum TaxID=268346 RepID=UPI002548B322|nr:uncharacterized protein N7519_002910 [Penicillium mononematosum]KAJ6188002.1 hypothetical protein N7519_002910 [Penicillium mononematosum]